MTEILQKLKRFYWLLLGKNNKKVLIKLVKKETLVATAYIWRRLLFNTTFIAVSGSVGKTTTKEFLAEILAQKYPTVSTLGNSNARKFRGLEKTILSVRPWHKFAVIEVGIEAPGEMTSAAKFLHPDIVLILNIKRCHTNLFKTTEAIAHEKSQLLNYLSDKGCAILNQDNSLIANMVVNAKANVIRFGASESCDIRLISTESRWPERLKLSILVDGENHDIKTRLVGTHWAPTILASLATAHYCGIPIKDAIKSLQLIEPFWARMQPIYLPSSGATILRDDWNGSIDTYEVAFKVLDEARVARKIVVFSDFSDSTKKLRKRANYLGRMGAKYADIAIFVGDYADRSVRTAQLAGLSEEHVHGFFSHFAVIEFLKKELQSGDFVLIKGQFNHHLSRIYLGLIGPVECEKAICSMHVLCDRCPELGFEWAQELQGFIASPSDHC